MKQFLLYLLLPGIVACINPAPVSQNKLTATYWLSDSLQPYVIDTITGEKTIYGSADLLYLDGQQHMKMLSGDFYWQNDTLHKGGEPGVTVKSGTWAFADGGLIFTDTLLQRTFLLPGDSIGKAEEVYIKMIGDSILMHESAVLVPVSKLSANLKAFMNANWKTLD